MNLLALKPVTNRIQSWKLLLEELDVELVHINRKDNLVADHLSRAYSIQPIQEINISKLVATYHTLQDYVELPEEQATQLLTTFHDEYAHPGINKTYNSIKKLSESQASKRKSQT